MTRTIFVLWGSAAACLAAVSLAASAAVTPGAESSGGAVTSVAPAPPVAKRSHRLVYSCRDGQVTVYADRPCGEASLLRSLEVYTPAPSGRPPTTEPAAAKSSTRPAPQDDQARSLREAAEKCERLQKSLEDVDDRMRAGYPAREAGRLWQRWRDAKEALRTAEC